MRGQWRSKGGKWGHRPWGRTSTLFQSFKNAF